MHRLLRVTGMAAMAAAMAAMLLSVAAFGGAAGAQSVAGSEDSVDSGQAPKTWIGSCGEVAGVCVHAAERSQLKVVDRPRTNLAPTVVCVWYPYGDDPGGWDHPDGPVPAPFLLLGSLYVVDCHRVFDGGRVVGYPRSVVSIPGSTVTGEVVSVEEVARHAVGRLGLEPPVAALAPYPMQLVGVETWLAVASRLRGYPERSAQAGSVWATVRAYFADATWDLGEHGRLVCTDDADRTWNPSLPGDRQSSDCTTVFESASGPTGLDATVTLRWQIYWQSSDHTGWRRHDDYSLSTPVALDIRELQAVIR